ncbi:MAG TPA: hypothetical protein PLR71_03410 [Deltaproteobacteria bacterium]|nr:hypothetical protein [Deltaproteobacteria bacterium]HQI80586.1 hypothetical protein [Deltaproteobacteria bacterium]
MNTILKTVQHVLPAVFCLCLLQCAGSDTLPGEISGTWTTSDESCAGEYIELTEKTVAFGIEGGERHEFPVIKVEADKGHLFGSTLYSIYYADAAGAKNLFRILYTPEDGGTLRQKSAQDVIWKRK